MKRRTFLRSAGLLPIPLLLGRTPLAAHSFAALAAAAEAGDRVLVLVQLDGGNDGLNSVIPLDQYAGLSAVRGNILLPEKKVLKIEDTLGLHPSLAGLQRLYLDGEVAVIQGVGYPGQNRSHFRSGDIWNTGSASDEVLTTGWLGRHLDVDHANTEPTDPFALVMGNSVSETCQGRVSNYSVAIKDIDQIGQLPTFAGGVDLTTPYGQELEWLRNTTVQSNVYAKTINKAVGKSNTVAEYPADNPLAEKLRSVARLIAGGLQTRIYIVQLGGFDTHAGQVEESDTTQGVHADLLSFVSTAITAFQRDLQALKLSERVVGFTYSEFGRRIRSNGSEGSDHGDAAPVLIFGSCVRGGVKGRNASIDPEVGMGEAVPMQYDFRDVYGSLLVDWFGVEKATIKQLLKQDYVYLPLLNDCSTPTSTGDPIKSVSGISVSPNPLSDRSEVSFSSTGRKLKMELFGANGKLVRELMDKKMPAGNHRLPLRMGRLPTGTYFLHFTPAGSKAEIIKVIKR